MTMTAPEHIVVPNASTQPSGLQTQGAPVLQQQQQPVQVQLFQQHPPQQVLVTPQFPQQAPLPQYASQGGPLVMTTTLPQQQQPQTAPPAYSHQNPIPEEALPRNVYICHLDFGTPETKLAELFQPFGEIESLKLMLNVTTGRSRGCAFILFKNHADAVKAIAKMNDAIIDGRCVHVKFADNTAKPSSGKKTRTAVDIVQGITPPTVIRGGMDSSVSSNMSGASTGGMSGSGTNPAGATAGAGAVLAPALPAGNVLLTNPQFPPQQPMMVLQQQPQQQAAIAQPQQPVMMVQMPKGQLAQVVQQIPPHHQAHQIVQQQPIVVLQNNTTPAATPSQSAAPATGPLLNLTPPQK